MSQGITVKIEGLDKLARTLNSKSKLGRAITKGLHKSALRVERDAKILAPVDTGALRASIHIQKLGKFKYKISDGVEYGVIQELGTKNRKGTFFLRRALKKNKKKFISDIKSMYSK